jgi:hypothetical protein
VILADSTILILSTQHTSQQQKMTTPLPLAIETAKTILGINWGSVYFHVDKPEGTGHIVKELPTDENQEARHEVMSMLKDYGIFPRAIYVNEDATEVTVLIRDFGMRKPLVETTLTQTDPSFSWWKELHEDTKTCRFADAYLLEGHYIKYQRTLQS